MNEMVYLDDLSEFVGVLENAASRTAEDVATQVIHTMGDEVAHLAYQYAPKRTHTLAKSIRAIHGPRESRVVATAPYAAYVEFGTWQFNVIAPKQGTYTITPKRPGGVLRFTTANGDVVYTRKVEHPGIPAQLFMARANQEVIEKFTSQIANVGVILVTG